MLQLNFEKGWGGGERQTLFNMIGFRDSGYEVALLCRKNCPLAQKSNEAGFETFAFSNVISAAFFLAFRCRKYNIMQVQASHILTYAVITKFLHQAKIIFTRRIDNVPKGAVTRWKYSIADKIVVISEAVKKVIENFINRETELISDACVKKELNIARAKKLTDDLNIQEGTFIIGTTTSVTKTKAPLVMLEAIRILFQKKKNFVFLHFGSGDLENEMRKKIDEYHLNNVYYLIGFKENPEDFFSVMNMFTRSSILEGLGSSVLDAFMYKVPVVVTDAGGLAELVQDGRGILCKKNSAESLAEGMERLMDTPDMIKPMTDQAYDYVNKFHSIAYITKQYTDLISQLGVA